jgi:hypothetical protein
MMITNTHFSINIGKPSKWSKAKEKSASVEDAPQLEYDDNDIELVADRGKFLSIYK